MTEFDIEEKNVNIFAHPLIEGTLAVSIGLGAALGVAMLLFK